MARNQGFNTGSDSLRELFLNACKNGEEAKVNAAIVLGVDVNFMSEQRPETGLILAIHGTHDEQRPETGLISAIRGKHYGVVDILLSHPEIDINLKNSKNNFPLAMASSLGMTSVVAKLGQMPTLQGVNDKAHDELGFFWEFSRNSGTPLSLATKKGKLYLVPTPCDAM